MRAPLGVLVLVRAPLGVLLRIFLYTIFLVAIVLSNNYDSPRGHKHPHATWTRKFAKAGFTSLQTLGEYSSSITGQVI